MVLPLLARLLRLGSIVISLIALASFAAFALDETSGASNHQQAEVNAAAPADRQTTTIDSSDKDKGRKSAFHKAVDEAFSTLSSPFSGVTSGSNSQWTIHIVDTLLVLLVYGFGLGFLARLVRVNL